MFNDVADTAIFGGFSRLRDFPLDPSEIVQTKEDLLEYILEDSEHTSIAYAGQIVAVKEEGCIYLILNRAATIEEAENCVAKLITEVQFNTVDETVTLHTADIEDIREQIDLIKDSYSTDTIAAINELVDWVAENEEYITSIDTLKELAENAVALEKKHDAEVKVLTTKIGMLDESTEAYFISSFDNTGSTYSSENSFTSDTVQYITQVKVFITSKSTINSESFEPSVTNLIDIAGLKTITTDDIDYEAFCEPNGFEISTTNPLIFTYDTYLDATVSSYTSSISVDFSEFTGISGYVMVKYLGSLPEIEAEIDEEEDKEEEEDTNTPDEDNEDDEEEEDSEDSIPASKMDPIEAESIPAKEMTQTEVSTEGLVYELSSDSSYYTVTGIENDASTLLIIPAEYDSVPVTTIASGAFKDNTTITTVIIRKNVTSIGAEAFYGCSELTSIMFENASGWTAGATAVDSSELSNVTTAATYLTDTYYDVEWVCTSEE